VSVVCVCVCACVRVCVCACVFVCVYVPPATCHPAITKRIFCEHTFLLL
jgi:hypothetical protein